MNIRNIKLNNITVLAPLAGITNLPFRLIVKEAGCGLVCSEMISSNALSYGSKKTIDMMHTCAEEKPVSVQIFGADPAIIAYAAKMAQEAGADILDINFGCSVKKILKSGAGAALMKEPEKTKAILTKTRAAVNIPLTIKIRSGWDPTGKDAFKIAQIAEDCGVDAIAFHPRTATQGFIGKSDWSLITRMKQQVSVPIIGNGDISEPKDAIDMLNQTGCDAIMVGRAAIGNPWIFSQIHALLKNEKIPLVDLSRRFNTMKKYVAASVEYIGELHACRMMRSRLSWFVKGLPNSSRFRKSITKIRTLEEAETLIDEYFDFLLEKEKADSLKVEGER
ncbi:MAG: tRNA dihydrouridine synthase DusB [Desulfobacteraceae bacterium]|nr:tRNA dihydrouridine synthase DusB [Desulfobacteraceae bacterium]MBC2758136.1 tRNA dihydrouridine synthase DusB [Desulfobacteraceae bacterium]